MKNYCGPDSSPEWVKSMLSSSMVPGGSMNKACKIHDKDYSTRGYSKKKADIKMLGNGIKHNWWNPYGWVKSAVYYLAVAFGGNESYKTAQDYAVIIQNNPIRSSLPEAYWRKPGDFPPGFAHNPLLEDIPFEKYEGKEAVLSKLPAVFHRKDKGVKNETRG